MKLVVGFIIFLSSLSSFSFIQTDLMDTLYANFKTGNAKEVARSFASSVEFILVDEENVYSKAQTEQILRDFFIKNPPTAFTKIHSVGNNNPKNRFGVILLQTKNGKFRVSITLTKRNTDFLITELRIESEK